MQVKLAQVKAKLNFHDMYLYWHSGTARPVWYQNLYMQSWPLFCMTCSYNTEPSQPHLHAKRKNPSKAYLYVSLDHISQSAVFVQWWQGDISPTSQVRLEETWGMKYRTKALFSGSSASASREGNRCWSLTVSGTITAAVLLESGESALLIFLPDEPLCIR